MDFDLQSCVVGLAYNQLHVTGYTKYYVTELVHCSLLSAISCYSTKSRASLNALQLTGGWHILLPAFILQNVLQINNHNEMDHWALLKVTSTFNQQLSNLICADVLNSLTSLFSDNTRLFLSILTNFLPFKKNKETKAIYQYILIFSLCQQHKFINEQ